MSDYKAVEKCDCPADCNSNQYSYSVSSTILDPGLICKNFKNEFSDFNYTGVSNFMINYETTVRGTAMGNFADKIASFGKHYSILIKGLLCFMIFDFQQEAPWDCSQE